MMQGNLPLTTTQAALAAARAAGVRTLLNPAPVRWPASEPWPLCDVAVVNQTEAMAFTGTAEPIAALERLIAAGARTAVVTLGALAVRWLSDAGPGARRAEPVSAIDATGAGHSFCGALCAALAAGAPLPSDHRRREPHSCDLRHSVRHPCLLSDACGGAGDPWRPAAIAERRFTDILRESAATEWSRMQAHPFVRAIEADALPPDALRRYLIIECGFVDAAIAICGYALVKAPDLATRRELVTILRGLTEDQMPFFSKALAELGVTGEPWHEPPAAGMLREGMLGFAAHGEFGDVLTAMLAAEWTHMFSLQRCLCSLLCRCLPDHRKADS